MTTKQVKQIIKKATGVSVMARKANGSQKGLIGIFGWNLDELPADVLRSLFIDIQISSNGQAWIVS